MLDNGNWYCRNIAKINSLTKYLISFYLITYIKIKIEINYNNIYLRKIKKKTFFDSFQSDLMWIWNSIQCEKFG